MPKKEYYTPIPGWESCGSRLLPKDSQRIDEDRYTIVHYAGRRGRRAILLASNDFADPRPFNWQYRGGGKYFRFFHEAIAYGVSRKWIKPGDPIGYMGVMGDIYASHDFVRAWKETPEGKKAVEAMEAREKEYEEAMEAWYATPIGKRAVEFLARMEKEMEGVT
jgi:hypothetical protein